jgi:hypothetical protein
MRHAVHFQHRAEGRQRYGLGQRLLVSPGLPSPPVSSDSQGEAGNAADFRIPDQPFGAFTGNLAEGQAPGSRRAPGGPRAILAAALAASFLLHGLLLIASGNLHGSWLDSGQASDGQAQNHAWLRARLAASTPSRPVETSPTPAIAVAPAPAGAGAARPAGADGTRIVDRAAALPSPPVPIPEEPAPAAAVPPENHATEGIGLLPAPVPEAEAPVYFEPRQLDQRAVPIASVDPQPERASRVPVTIRLQLFISAAGTVDKVDVLSVTPEDYPADFAVRAFATARFDAARIAEVPVASVKTIELTFEPF